MTSSQLRVFVSSKMQELAPERLAIKTALEELKIDGWVFENDAGARPQTIQQTYLDEVEGADLYIGLFWRGYGDYTIDEYEHARRLGKDCLIYEKRADIDGHRDARLATFLTELGDVGNGVTSKWFDTSEELKEFVKQDVARWQADIVRRYKVSGAPVTYQPPQPAEERNRKELSILLNKVEQFWIKGVLESSVHQQVLIELGKKMMGEAVEHPWESVLELPHKAAERTPTSERITDWFAGVGRYLLILGEPGSGKTITLLELARDLIAQARKDKGHPIPTVFNLSSWLGKGESIIDWMVRELKDKYQVPKKTSGMWLEQQLLLPLLDGLDEVSPDLQRACVEAINEFVQEYQSGLVVCSRLQEYMSLPVRLKLNGAICIQPLSSEQVDQYLGKAGPSLAALREVLKGDDNFRELIKTPLMLSIMSLAYEDRSLIALEKTDSETVESLRSHVFDTYIDRMIQRKGKARHFYSKEKLNAWLGWLARQMKSRSQSIFLIEQLQADWLATRRQRFCYILISRLLAGLFLGSGLGLAGWMIEHSEVGSVKFAPLIWLIIAALGLLFGVVSTVITCVKELLVKKVGMVRRAAGFRYSLIEVGIYALTWFAIILIVPWIDSGRLNDEDLFIALFGGIGIGVLHWFLFEAQSERHRAVGDITMIETLRWSWTRALKSGLKGTLVAGLIFLPITIFFELVQGFNNAFDFLFFGLLSVGFVLFGGIVGFLFGGFKEGIIERKTKPNQGVRLTMRNATLGAVTMGLPIAVIIGLIAMPIDQSFSFQTSLLKKLLFVAGVSMLIGLPVAFRNGGYEVIKHYSLRAVLLFSKSIPRNFIKVLNHAVALILLQKVGGGYIFIHRTLLEHYAATYGDNKSPVPG